MNANGLGIVFHLISLAVVFFASFATEAFAQIYHVKDMNTEQIRALDRETTVVILPGGILEQHGPYLPSFTDGYMGNGVRSCILLIDSRCVTCAKSWLVLSE